MVFGIRNTSTATISWHAVTLRRKHRYPELFSGISMMCMCQAHIKSFGEQGDWWYFARRASLSAHWWFLLQAHTMRVHKHGSYSGFDERSLAPGHDWCFNSLPARLDTFLLHLFFLDKMRHSIAWESERCAEKMGWLLVATSLKCFLIFNIA